MIDIIMVMMIMLMVVDKNSADEKVISIYITTIVEHQ